MAAPADTVSSTDLLDLSPLSRLEPILEQVHHDCREEHKNENRPCDLGIRIWELSFIDVSEDDDKESKSDCRCEKTEKDRYVRVLRTPIETNRSKEKEVAEDENLFPLAHISLTPKLSDGAKPRSLERMVRPISLR